MIRSIALAVSALTLVAPLPALAQGNGARPEIEKISKAFEKAFNAGDAATISTLYTKDAKLMPPGAEPATGPEAIKAAFDPIGKSHDKIQLTVEDVTGTGATALESGKWVMTGADGKHLDHGQYLVYYKKEAGSWKIYRDIWNSSMAPK